MLKRKLSTIILAATITNMVATPINVFAETLNSEVVQSVENLGEEKSAQATITKFSLYGDEVLDSYNEVFKMNNSNIKSITNNGGKYASSSIDKAIDGNFQTHWETGTPNSTTFTNEVVIELEEVTTLNRIVYGARRDASGKGFAQEVEIYASTGEENDEFELVAEGAYSGSSLDVVEIKFAATEFKKLKFVFKNANSGWASASEFMLYKEDTVSDKMDRLFTDETLSVVSEEFNTIEKINALDEEVKVHPLYEDFKENIENAKKLLAQGSIEASKAIVSRFDVYYSEYIDEYNEVFKMNNSNISGIETNGGHLGSYVKDRMLDGDLNTFWETGKQNSDSFKNEIVFTLKEAEVLDRMVYRSAANTIGFAEEFEIWTSNTTKGDTFQLVTAGSADKTSDMIELSFEPTEFKRIKFVYKTATGNKPSASEVMFYKEDSLPRRINNVFTDGTQVELSPEYSSLEAIEALEAEIESHPYRDTYRGIIEVAKELIQNPDKYEGVYIYTASQRGDSAKEAQEHGIPRTSYTLYSYGKYISPEETIKVYVDADENGVLPKLVLGEVGSAKGSWAKFIELKPGLNVITAPSIDERKPSAIYIYNGALPDEQAYAPRIRIEGGTSYPVYRHGETDPNEFLEELEEYNKKVSVNDEDFANRINEDIVYNMAEITSENNTISTSATGALRGLKELASENKTVYDTMECWEMLWHSFQEFSGFSEDAEDARNQIFDQKFTTRVFSGGGYGWSGHGYVGLNGGSDEQNPNRDGGFFKEVVKPITTTGSDTWAYVHEWGHNINNVSIEHLEVTNNLYSRYMTKALGQKMDWCGWDTMFDRFSGDGFKADFWTNLGILTQPIIYFGDDLYGKASAIARTNPDGILDGLSGNLQRLAVTYSVASGYNLLEHFEGWGYVEATELMKEKVNHLPKLDKKIEYLHGGAEDYVGNGFNENIDVKVSTSISKADSTVTLSFSIDDNNKEDLLGYEILKDGEVIGYTRKNSFVVENANVDENIKYEVVPYAKDLSTASAIEVNTFTPSISLQQENILVSLNDDFNEEELAKGLNHNGEDITSKVKIESNVDTSKKGIYEVKYTLSDNDIEVYKTVNVEVVSKYDYLSDNEWESVETAWGTPRRNTNLQGRVNGEVKTFEKGFGIHANGKIVYDLSDSNYDTFEALVGVDMTIAAQDRSSIVFKIIGDGEVLATTDNITYYDNMIAISVPVTGVQKLEIEISDGGNGNSSDHGVIVNPKLSNNNIKPQIKVEDKTVIKFKDEFDIMNGVSASDVEDGDLTNNIEVNSNGFNINKPGRYDVEYKVTDSDGNTTTKNREIFVYSSSEYVSDVEWVSATTDWRTVNKDLSALGVKIKVNINGEEKVFDKGVGTHANSEIVYNLEDTNYEYFESYVGVDRNVAGAGRSSVIFKIYADGEEVYNSGVMKWEDDAKFVRVSLEGVSELKLVANDAGNGNSSDHASFADAKFLITNSKPKIELTSEKVSTKVGLPIDLTAEYTANDSEDGDLTNLVVVTNNVNFNKAGTYTQEFTVTDSDGNTSVKTREVAVVDMKDFTYLSDINWKSGNAGSALRKDVSTGNTAMRLLGEDGETVNYSKGIGTHSYSTIIYDLSNSNYDYFSSFIGIDRQMINRESSVEFQVFLDGDLAYDSGLMQANDVQKFIELNITGVNELKLVVTDYDGTRGADWANWADAKLHSVEEGIEVNKNELNALIEKINGLNSEIYTEESFNNLQATLGQVNDELVNGYNQEEVNTLFTKLNEAYEALVKSTDYSVLEETLANNSEYNELHYFRDAMDAHKVILEEARVMLVNKEVTQEEIDSMLSKIIESAKALVVRQDKVELGERIEEAKLIENNNYNEIRWSNLLSGIEFASEVYNNIDASDYEVYSARFTLDYFIDELK